MIQGTKVIFNNDYIEEITRHRDNAQKVWENELMPDAKEKAKKALDSWEDRLEWALSFEDILDEVKNVDVPNITIFKTMGGYELPAKHIQIV